MALGFLMIIARGLISNVKKKVKMEQNKKMKSYQFYSVSTLNYSHFCKIKK